MQIRIPDIEQRKYTKPSVGEIFGNLWATRNLDFTRNKGKITPAERLYRIVDEGDVATMEIPVAFVRSNADTTDRWWALTQKLSVDTNDGVLINSTNSAANSAWALAAVGSDPTDCVDDMCIFGSVAGYDRLVVARDTDLAMLNQTWTASWWDTTLAQAALSNDYPHILHQFLNLLIVTDGNVAHTIDDSLVVVASRITLPAEYVINWIADDGLRVYFGTKHKRGGEALVFPWNGTSEKYDEPIPVMSDISFAGVAKNGVLHIVNGLGQLLAYNGQTFQEVAHFPIKDKIGMRWYFNQTDSVAGGRGSWNTVLHHNGIDVIDGNIHILIAAGIGGASAVPFSNFPCGIWEYDEDIGLYCKYAFGQYDGSTDNDYGGIGSIATAGALKRIPKEEGKLIAGAIVYTDNTATTYKVAVIGKGTAGSGRGYLITSEINSSDFRALWKRLKLSFRKMDNSTDRIVLKYRTEKDTYFTEDVRTSITAAFGTTSRFTSTSTEMANAIVGDEVEVLCGKGAGAVVHISVIAYADPTYTVDIDEAIPNISGNVTIRIRNWKKLGSISDQGINKKVYTITKRSKFLQIKIELRGTHLSPEIEEILLEYNESKK